MESRDKGKEYEHSVWEIYRKEWATASPEKKTELNKRMRRWQELMKSGLTAQQAYYKAMEGELGFRVAEEPSGKQLAIPSAPRMRKAPLIFLSLALVVSIVYCIIITGDRNALNTELESVQSNLASTQSDLKSTKQRLTSTQSELGSTKQALTSTEAELEDKKQALASTQSDLNSTKQTLTSIQNDFEAAEAKLKLYEETLGVKVFSDIKKIIEKGGGGLQEINLTDNPSAVNPTWQELKEFLLADPTDDKTYIKDIFDCSQFAEMLHNNAETQGIKATYTTVKFRESDIGHALNAFKTTDRGLVYVDCTGGLLSIRRTSQERDKIAYVVKGKEYGAISLGKNTPLNYASYEKMKADWDSYDAKLEAYNKEVRRFNREIFGKVYIGLAEWYRDKEWGRTLEEQARVLENLRAQLEYVWESKGIVESIKIYW